jgi:lysyl-tRNA synthetase class I
VVVVRKMDSARSWLSKFQPRDKLRASSRKKDDVNGGIEDSNASLDDDALSSITKQKVAAAKQYIENHYKEQMKNLQERKERYNSFHSSFVINLFIVTISADIVNHQISLRLCKAFSSRSLTL